MIAKPTILVLMGGYWPGHEATGPNQSLRQMCAALQDAFCFRILSRDRPFGAAAPLGREGMWLNHLGGAVRYARVRAFGPEYLAEIVRETPHDLLWLNGFHDREFTVPALLLRRFGRIPRRPVLVSTRGELAAGALGLKAARKHAYRVAARALGLLDDAYLHAASREEAADAARWYPWVKGAIFAPNVREMIDAPAHAVTLRDQPGRLRVAFTGRIVRMKNIAFALEALALVRAPVTFHLYGPIEDAAYWRACQGVIARLPAHVSVRHEGAIAHAEIPAALGAADIFFLPTLGENFGHSIFEALACGAPALISDRTPWRHLARRRAGWDLPLGDPAAFAAQLDAFAAMTTQARRPWREGARAAALAHVAESGAAEAVTRMIETVCAGGDGMGAAVRAPPLARSGAA